MHIIYVQENKITNTRMLYSIMLIKKGCPNEAPATIGSKEDQMHANLYVRMLIVKVKCAICASKLCMTTN